MSETRTEKVGPNAIKIAPLKGLVIIEQLKVKSIYEEEKKTTLMTTAEQIAQYNKQIIESTKDATKVWSKHPDQGIIVALHPDDAEAYELRVGDKIAFNHSEYTGVLFMYNKKRYLGLRPGEIICRYLTDEV